jgi:hypothetical protein
MRETLKRRNEDLHEEIEKIIQLGSTAQIVAELEPYRTVFLAIAENLLTKVRSNLRLLGLAQEGLLVDVLSETSTLIQRVRLLKFRYLRGLYRAETWDLICLRTITWLHTEHEATRTYPAVFADDDVSIIPSTVIPFYFFPCLEQRGLRFQPLFFHEFGHLLYQCHRPEMDALVGEFQQAVEAELLPASQRNDQFAQEQARSRQSIVETWYKWIQEFFCDAIGLVIGGPCFLNAFSEYVCKFLGSDFYRQPADLHGSTHPISCLRVRMLAERAHAREFPNEAATALLHWSETATALKIKEDYHGFYTASLKPMLVRTIDDMLTEASPYHCTSDDAAGIGWNSNPPNLPALLNLVWQKYREAPRNFAAWESSVLKVLYGLSEE